MYDKDVLCKTIENTLLDMLTDTDISDIRVQKLVDKAGISKATFYRNYNNVDDVLKQIELELITGLKDINALYSGDRLKSRDAFRENGLRVNQYIYDNRFAICRINSIHGDPQFMIKMCRILFTHLLSVIDNSKEVNKHKELYIIFMVNGIAALNDYWLEKHPELTVEEMSELVESMFQAVLNNLE